MRFAFVVCVAWAGVACVPATPAAKQPDPIAKAPEMCPEPTKIERVDAAPEPAAPVKWVRGAGEDHLVVSDGARRYTMSLEGALAATSEGKIVWNVAAMEVAGGGFDVMLSPKGSFVARYYSRGGIELFDAADGKLLRKVGVAFPSPDDRFVIEVPRVPFGLDAWDHHDVRYVPMDPKEPVRSIVTLPDKDVPAVAADVCASGSLIAISYVKELSIYRTTDLTKLASFANPGEGAPAFTKSGRYVVLGEKTAFALRP